MIPAAFDARFDHVGTRLRRPGFNPTHLLSSRHAMSLRLESVPEHVRDQLEFGFFTNRAHRGRLGTDIAGGSDQFRMRIAHRLLAEPPSLDLADQHATGEPMVNDAPRPTIGATNRADREGHEGRG